VLRLRRSRALRGAVAPAVLCATRCCDSSGPVRCEVLKPPCKSAGYRCATDEPCTRFASFGFAQTRYVLPCGIVFRGCTSAPRRYILQNVYVVSHSPRSHRGVRRCKALWLRGAWALRGAEGPLWLGVPRSLDRRVACAARVARVRLNAVRATLWYSV